ncbi:MAG: hypothetical protein M0T85_01390 [Dehalococcoidales bacterium]|nr:hypothetical protein [Dehalococcoidales bacterium]
MSRSVHVDRQPEGDVLPEAVAAALIRDHFGLFALGGVYLVMALNSMPRRLLLEACGFERVPEARTWVYGPEDPFDGYVLDLTYIGVERWFEAIVRGQRPPKVRNRSELERELEDALQHWRDDAWLAESNLARAVAPLDLETAGERAEALRELVTGILASAASGVPSARKESYRALELRFIRQTGSDERTAGVMSISRATFYRLLKRGIEELADDVQRYLLDRAKETDNH